MTKLTYKMLSNKKNCYFVLKHGGVRELNRLLRSESLDIRMGQLRAELSHSYVWRLYWCLVIYTYDTQPIA
jgi:hypothetical protein